MENSTAYFLILCKKTIDFLFMLLYNKSRYKRKHKKGQKTMQIQVKDNSRNGKIIVRNLNAQRKVERQLNEILARIKKTNEELRSI